jgi:hypothetical protein
MSASPLPLGLSGEMALQRASVRDRELAAGSRQQHDRGGNQDGKL